VVSIGQRGLAFSLSLRERVGVRGKLVRFVYVFEAVGQGRPLIGGFRVEAKGVNGRVVLLTCHNLRRYSCRARGLTTANAA
jgi:hypothetical protein